MALLVISPATDDSGLRVPESTFVFFFSLSLSLCGYRRSRMSERENDLLRSSFIVNASKAQAIGCLDTCRV